MHTVKQINDIARGIDALMVLGVGELSGYAQAALEIDAIAVYLSTQISTLKHEIDREQAMADLMSHLRIAVEARREATDPADALLTANF